MLTRIESQLAPELEDLISRTIGCLIEVHRHLGPGYLEAAYQRAACIELTLRGIPFEQQKVVDVFYKGRTVLEQKLDLVIDGRLIVELKAIAHLEPVHTSQLVSYLAACDLRVGLLVNFNVIVLKSGLKRVIR